MKVGLGVAGMRAGDRPRRQDLSDAFGVSNGWDSVWGRRRPASGAAKRGCRVGDMSCGRVGAARVGRGQWQSIEGHGVGMMSLDVT